MVIDKDRIKAIRNIDEKVDVSKDIIREALKRYSREGIALAMTGGKDSTLGLWLFKQVCDEDGLELPQCMFIDEGDVFDEIQEFVELIKKQWNLNITVAKNADVSSKVSEIGGIVDVAALNDTNRAALEEFGLSEKEFPFVPDSTVCNHLMKTIPMREFIATTKIQALATAIRWDEQDARKEEDYFSERDNPAHTRIHPILHFTERDVWIATFKYGIPFNSLYRLGYRSLGARCATGKDTDVPAWMQDLENTPERVGRGQEKEQGG